MAERAEQQTEEPSYAEVQGRVTRVIYRVASDFGVFEVRGQDKNDVTVVTRTDTNLTRGDRVRVRGHWSQHPKYGTRLDASVILHDVPRDVNGAHSFLSKRHIPGVGRGTADRLLDTYGDDLVNALADRDRLIEDGLVSADVATALANRFCDNSDRTELMLLLHGASIPDKTVQAAIRHIVDHHGQDVMNVVREDPWVLAEVENISFAVADQLATSHFGMAYQHPKRIRAAARHVMKDYIERRGDCATTRSRLEKGIHYLIPGVTDRAVDDLFAHIDGGSDQELVYDSQVARYYRRRTMGQESRLGRIIGDMADKTTEIDDEAVERHLLHFEQEGEVPNLDPEQREGLVTALTNRLAVVTGGPGTGKSTIMDLVVRIAETYGYTVQLVAPTGRAAKRLNETTGRDSATAHRVLGFDAATRQFMKNENDPLEADWVICDETSMMDLGTSTGLARAIPENANFTVVGDVDQLPSVGPGQVLRDLIDSDQVPVARLQTVHRTGKKSQIPAVAQAINRGEDPKEVLDDMRGFGMRFRQTPEAIAAELVKTASEELPARGIDPKTSIQVLTPTHKGEAGVKRLNERLKEALNPADDDPERTQTLQGRTFTVGDRVIHNKNNYFKQVMNGEVGRVSRVGTAPNDDQVEVPFVEVDYDDRTAVYDTSDIAQLEQAWCVTIHRSQGCEYPVVLMACADDHRFMLERSLVYTGLTRAKSSCLVVGSNSAFRHALATTEKSYRETALDQRIRDRVAPQPGPEHDIGLVPA